MLNRLNEIGMITYRPCTSAELPLIADLLGRGMGVPRPGLVEKLAAWPADCRRLVGPSMAPLGTLGFWRSSQSLGGGDVPAVGLSAVAVVPEARGQGVGAEMLGRYHAEMRAEGLGLSLLYPANWPFYRKCGAELAGHQWRRRYPIKDLTKLVMPRTISVRRQSPPNWAELDALAERLRPLYPGHLRRPLWRWPIAVQPAEAPAIDVYLFDRDGETVGYAVLCPDTGQDRVLVTDCMVADGQVAQAVLALVASFAGIVAHFTWTAGPDDPLSAAIPDKHWLLERERRWMARVLDISVCLAGRGYPLGLATTLVIQIEDTGLPDNAGLWRLDIADGRASLTRTRHQSPDISVGAGGLAALVTGGQPAASLVHQGLLSGSPQGVSLAGLVFGGPTPWLQEFF